MATGAGKRILVIDDDEDIRTMVCLVLERERYEVEAYGDAASALAQVNRTPDLILLDYMMPQLGAPGFLLARKHNEWLRSAPVVIISAYPELADIALTETVGIVHKPMDLEILLECVRFHSQGPPHRP